MFDRAIIDTDKFMDLPISAKALYFLLGMDADDEGFVSYKKVLRIHGGNEDDIKILVAKNFLIPFQSGVVVITDWNRNNYLDKNRIRYTEYRDEKSLISLTHDNKYVLNECLTTVKPNDKIEANLRRLTSVKPEESSIEENRVEESSIEEVHQSITFEQFWNLYPKKVERLKSQQKWLKISYELQLKIIDDIPRRIFGKQWKEGYIPNPTTYLNGERWNDEIIPVKNNPGALIINS